MSSVTPRKRDGCWYADLHYLDPITGRTKRRQLSAGKKATQKTAIKLGWKWLHELEQTGKLFDNQNDDAIPFNGFAGKFLDQYVKVHNKPSGYRNAECALRVHWVPAFGNLDIRNINAEVIERCMARMKQKGLKAKSIKNYLAVLGKLFNKAIDWDYLETNPLRKVTKPKVEPRKFDFWDVDQTIAFLETAERSRPDLHAFFLTASLTGMRLGELCGLQWGDVDFVKGNFIVRNNYVRGNLGSTKSGKNRVIPIHQLLGKVLKAHRHLRGDFVFCREDGSPLEVNDCRKPFFWLTKKAGLPRIRFHDLRHSFASQLVMNGKSLKVVQELLGHGSIMMTEIYSHLSLNVHQGAINSLLNWETTVDDDDAVNQNR